MVLLVSLLKTDSSVTEKDDEVEKEKQLLKY